MTYTGYTFTPSISVDDQGREYFDGEGSLQSHSAQTVDVPYEEDPLTGQTRYLLDEEDFQQDEDYEYSSDTHEQYVEALLEAYPHYHDAIAWAGSNWTEEQITAYDAAMDSEDLDELMPYIEHMLSEYEFALAEGNVEAPDADTDEDVELDPEEAQGIVDEAFEFMSEQEPLGAEEAYSWLEEAAETADSDPVYSSLCQLSAEFHKGNMSLEEAFNYALSNHNQVDLLIAYGKLTGLDQ